VPVVLVTIGLQALVLAGGGIFAWIKAQQLANESIEHLQRLGDETLDRFKAESDEAISNLQNDLDQRQEALVAFLQGVADSAQDNLQ